MIIVYLVVLSSERVWHYIGASVQMFVYTRHRETSKYLSPTHPVAEFFCQFLGEGRKHQIFNPFSDKIFTKSFITKKIGTIINQDCSLSESVTETVTCPCYATTHSNQWRGNPLLAHACSQDGRPAGSLMAVSPGCEWNNVVIWLIYFYMTSVVLHCFRVQTSTIKVQKSIKSTSLLPSHLCQCSQKEFQNDADLHWKAWQRAIATYLHGCSTAKFVHLPSV